MAASVWDSLRVSTIQTTAGLQLFGIAYMRTAVNAYATVRIHHDDFYFIALAFESDLVAL